MNETESSIIGAMLLDNAIITQVSEKLKVSDFEDPVWADAFKILIETSASGMGSDLSTLLHGLRLRKHDISASVLIESQRSCTPAVYERYVGIIKQDSLRRKVNAICRNAISAIETSGTPEAAIAFIEGELAKAKSGNDGKFSKIGEIVGTVSETIDRAMVGSGVSGTPTGFSRFDAMTGGLQNADLIILAARPAMGKSALASNIMLNVAEKGLVVIEFSLEMSKESIVLRTIATKSGVGVSDMQRGRISQDRLSSINEAMCNVSNLPIYVDDMPAKSIESIRNSAKYLASTINTSGQKLGLIVVDYLQLITSEKKHESRNLEIQYFSQSLKQLARELNVPVIALSQLSRKVEERSDKRPLMSDLRESGSIEQDADVIMFLWRMGYYNKDENPRVANIAIAKQRNGPTGDFLIEFDGATTTFKDFAYSDE